MGFVEIASCNACDYRSNGLLVGDGKHSIVGCRACRKVLSVECIPYRLNLPPCPGCGNDLRRTDLIGMANVSCPACGGGQLKLDHHLHFKTELWSRKPEDGALIHACYSDEGPRFGGVRFRIGMPGSWPWSEELLPVECEFDKSQPFEVEVVGTSEDNLFVRFVRQLNWDDF